MSSDNSLRLVTYNIGGGRKAFPTIQPEIIEPIHELSPDVLAVQECAEWVDENDVLNSVGKTIADSAGFKGNYYFGKTLSIEENMQVKKAAMIYSLYHDWSAWSQGNALYSKYGFGRFSAPSLAGEPRNIPLYRPAIYEGTRDTDPRYAIISRIRMAPLYPYVVCLHLTTLIGERSSERMRDIPGRSTEAQILRYQQSRALLALLKPKIEEKEVIIVMGDFNAVYEEACISSILIREAGFTQLVPTNDSVKTHPKVETPVDHILVYPEERICDYKCWIEDNETTRIASDHLPVVADLVLKV